MICTKKISWKCAGLCGIPNLPMAEPDNLSKAESPGLLTTIRYKVNGKWETIERRLPRPADGHKVYKKVSGNGSLLFHLLLSLL